MMAPAVLESVKAELERRFGLDALWLFGSVARGTETPESDVDLAGLFQRRPSALELLDARSALAVIVGRDVDLVDLETASPIVAMQALREGRLLVENAPSHRVRFASGLPGRYEDVIQMRAEAARGVLRRIEGG